MSSVYCPGHQKETAKGSERISCSSHTSTSEWNVAEVSGSWSWSEKGQRLLQCHPCSSLQHPHRASKDDILINFPWHRCLPFITCISFVCLTKVTHNSITTDEPKVLKFPTELEFRNVDFWAGFGSRISRSSQILRLLNTGWRVWQIFLLRSDSCLLTASADVWSLNVKLTVDQAI